MRSICLDRVMRPYKKSLEQPVQEDPCAIFEILKDQKDLEELNLSRNPELIMDAEREEQFLNYVKELTNLKKLTLQGMALSDKQTMSLVNTLKQAPCL